jgi:dTDP-4-dehydrorhamnose reductase
MSRWLVTGAAGMLGRDLVTVLLSRGELVTGLARAELDITDAAAVSAALARWRPEVVVNCAAWTAVDDAEVRQDAALAVNGQGAACLAAACAARAITLVHISTDYVFEGNGSSPYREDDEPAPRTAYGRTKLAGEQAVLSLHAGASYVLRTAWLYGAHGPNFVATMIRLAGQRPTVDVVADQRGQPTWTMDVAQQVLTVVSGGAPPGRYHATSSGETTWHGLAREVFLLLGTDPDRVRPVSSAAFARPAPRPCYSVLGHDRHAAAGLAPIGDWRAALRRAWPALTGTAMSARASR